MYKFGLLSTILYRYFSICSSFTLFHLEVLEFKKIFQKNGYPLKLIDACVQKFLSKIFVKKVITDTVPQRGYFITLPYLGPLSNKIQKRIKTVFQKIIPTGKINIVFKTERRVAHFLKFKDVIPSDLISHIIYQSKCPIHLDIYFVKLPKTSCSTVSLWSNLEQIAKNDFLFFSSSLVCSY